MARSWGPRHGVPALDQLAFVLVIVSSVLHVAWNAVLKTAGDPLRTAAVGLSAAAGLLLPVAAIAWWQAGRPAIPPEAMWLGIASGGLETLYFIFLANAYRRGDLSVVYPVARGSATLFAVAAGTLILQERLGPAGWLGVAGLIAGLLLLRPPWAVLGRVFGRRSPDRSVGAPSAAGLAVATGLIIAAYSAVDRVGVRLIEPWLYAAILWTSMIAGLWAVILAARRSARLAHLLHGPEPPRIDAPRAALGGVMTVVAYMLVLVAFRLAPLTAVAPLRESAVVLASGWGALGLRETSGRRAAALRIGAAGLIVAGAILLALDA